MLGLCIKLQPEYADGSWDSVGSKNAEAKAALALCLAAPALGHPPGWPPPHSAILRDVPTFVKVDDGTYVVGQDMERGTYRTEPGAKDCYWARSNDGGNIIAKNFIGFAHAGVTVAVYVGEGFESQRCGVWTRIG